MKTEVQVGLITLTWLFPKVQETCLSRGVMATERTSMYPHAAFASEIVSETIADKLRCKQQRSRYPTLLHIRFYFIYEQKECVRTFL